MLLSGPSWPFLRCSKLGPDNKHLLGPDDNTSNWYFLPFFCPQKFAEIPFLFFNINQHLAKKGPQKNANFSQFCKTGAQTKKTTFVATPFFQKLVFLVFFLIAKTLMLNKKRKSKSGNNKDNQEGSERGNKTGNQKKEKGLMKHL